MSCRLTEQMLQDVIFQNWDEVDKFSTTNKNPLINVQHVIGACHIIRQMYFDALNIYVSEIQAEDFYYSIPTEERKEILNEIQNLKISEGFNQPTIKGIISYSVSSLELLMLTEYEEAINTDNCESIIFNFKE